MSPALKKILSYVIPPVITVGLCYVLYSDVDVRTFTSWLPRCNFLFVALFLLCNVAAMLLRALRWRLQLRAIGVNPPYSVMARSIFGTYAVNLVFPRLGEIWRCAYVSKEQSAPFSGVFGTMVGDRLADTLTVLLISLAAFLCSSSAMARFLEQTSIGSTAAGLLTSWGVLLALLLLILLGLWLWRSRSALASRARGFLARVWQGFTVLFRMPRRLLWLLLTAAIWGAYITSMWLSLLSFPPTAAIVAANGPSAVILTFVFGSLAMAIPSNGGIGPWQFAIILSLSGLFGLDREVALTFATLNLAATTILTILLGLTTFATLLPSRR